MNVSLLHRPQAFKIRELSHQIPSKFRWISLVVKDILTPTLPLYLKQVNSQKQLDLFWRSTIAYLNNGHVGQNKHLEIKARIAPFLSLSTCARVHVVYHGGETTQRLPDQPGGLDTHRHCSSHTGEKVTFCALDVISKLWKI